MIREGQLSTCISVFTRMCRSALTPSTLARGVGLPPGALLRRRRISGESLDLCERTVILVTRSNSSGGTQQLQQRRQRSYIDGREGKRLFARVVFVAASCFPCDERVRRNTASGLGVLPGRASPRDSSWASEPRSSCQGLSGCSGPTRVYHGDSVWRGAATSRNH